MDYRQKHTVETDYGALSVIARVRASDGPVRSLWLLHRGCDKTFSVDLDDGGDITPESEVKLAKGLREMREALPIFDREEDWASDYLGGEYNDPEQE